MANSGGPEGSVLSAFLYWNILAPTVAAAKTTEEFRALI